MKHNEMKYIIFSKIYIILSQFEITPEKETETTHKLPDIDDKNK